MDAPSPGAKKPGRVRLVNARAEGLFAAPATPPPTRRPAAIRQSKQKVAAIRGPPGGEASPFG
jgi:hypothetical protein